MKLAIRTRQCIIHGVGDDIVLAKSQQGLRGAKSNAKENVRLMMIPGAGHFEIVDPRSGAWATVKNVLLEFVSKQKSLNTEGHRGDSG